MDLKFVVAFCGIIGLTMVYVVEGWKECVDITSQPNPQTWCNRGVTLFENFLTNKEHESNQKSETRVIPVRKVCCVTGFEPKKDPSMNEVKLY